jgi:hypothetical protein
MTCHEFLDHVPALVDGEPGYDLDASAEAHLASCESCQRLVADLRRIKRTAGTLDGKPVPPDAWHRVAARLNAEPGLAEARSQRVRGARPTYSWPWLAAAAALLVATVGVAWFANLGRPRTRSAGAEGNGKQEQLVQSIENELQLAADHYENAIAGLEKVASASDVPLDPEVLATLRKNLELIDGAIDESRAALQSQPGSRAAQESLFDAFRRKVALLQDTIALMNEMRKGDEAATARIVGGLSKS